MLIVVLFVFVAWCVLDIVGSVLFVVCCVLFKGFVMSVCRLMCIIDCCLLRLGSWLWFVDC